MSILIEALIETSLEWIGRWFKRPDPRRVASVADWLGHGYPASDDEVLEVLEDLRLRDTVIQAQVRHLEDLRRVCTCKKQLPPGSPTSA